MANQYVSIRQIADDLYDHPLLKDIPFERIVNYTVEFSRIMGLPQIFDENVALIKIKDHRGILPCDYYNVIQVKESCSNKVFIAATDSFYYSSTGCGPLTYKIQGGYIITSLDNGEIEFSYNAIPVDKNGYPMIPNDSSYIVALEAYIKKKRFTVLFDQAKIPANVFTTAQQDYYAAAALCRSSMSVPTVDEMEAITNMWTRLLPANHLHESGFIQEGLKEYRHI